MSNEPDLNRPAGAVTGRRFSGLSLQSRMGVLSIRRDRPDPADRAGPDSRGTDLARLHEAVSERRDCEHEKRGLELPVLAWFRFKSHASPFVSGVGFVPPPPNNLARPLNGSRTCIAARRRRRKLKFIRIAQTRKFGIEMLAYLVQVARERGR